MGGRSEIQRPRASPLQGRLDLPHSPQRAGGLTQMLWNYHITRHQVSRAVTDQMWKMAVSLLFLTPAFLSESWNTHRPLELETQTGSQEVILSWATHWMFPPPHHPSEVPFEEGCLLGSSAEEFSLVWAVMLAHPAHANTHMRWNHGPCCSLNKGAALSYRDSSQTASPLDYRWWALGFCTKPQLGERMPGLKIPAAWPSPS